MKKILIWLAVGLGSAYLYRKFKTATEIEVQVSNVKVKGSLFNPVLVVAFNLRNSTDDNLHINKISGDVYYQQQKIATFYQDVPFMINDRTVNNGNTLMEIQLVPNQNIFNIAKTLYTIVSAGNADFIFTGKVTLGSGLLLPFEINKNINLKS